MTVNFLIMLEILFFLISIMLKILDQNFSVMMLGNIRTEYFQMSPQEIPIPKYTNLI